MNGFRIIAGLLLLAASAGGASPLYGAGIQAGGVAWADSVLVTVNLEGFARYTLRSEPAGTVNQSTAVIPGTVIVTPDLSANPNFGYWTLDGMRQANAWGAAVSQLTFTVNLVDREAVAYLFSGDSDVDGVSDAYEQRYYGTLANGAGSDSDGDGISLIAEYTGGTNPLYGNSSQAGGVAWVDSALVEVNLEGLARYTLRSEPAGTVNQSTAVIPGTVIVTPDLSANPDFGYWMLDGVRQEDAWGAALSQLSFTVNLTDREAVAYLFNGDSDADGVPDAYEQRYYGTLTNNADSDSDSDGINLLTEYIGGTNPLYGNNSQAGGVVWADSALVEVDLSPVIPETGFALWQQSYFTAEEMADPATSGPQVVLTLDGLSNLLKYALGLEPTTVSSTGLPELTATSTDWVYTYIRPADRTDISYAVEVSTDLSIWTTVGVMHEKVSNVSGIETWRATYPLSSAPNGFFRLRVQEN
ncbi:MAG: hypothetical protein KA257_09910 [Opitutaceae bacterium]|nr:hypothetical protein [Opitutaceae bacterium]MBP9912262.1 hypothetical protein [Opitutaceae bacterium]